MIKHDQHFLIDQNVVNLAISASKITKNDIVLEVGPGKGVLTNSILMEKPLKLISVEIDENFKIFLKKIKSKYDNFEYIFANIFDVIDNIECTKLVANIPYSITEPLYQKIIEKKIEHVVLLEGYSFYDKISKNYSKWSYILNAMYNIKLIEKVRGYKFMPKTKVDSALVCLTIKNDFNQMDKFILSIFEKKNRNVKNSIMYSFCDAFSYTKKEALLLYQELGLQKDIETLKFKNLSNKDFKLIISKLEKNLENNLK